LPSSCLCCHASLNRHIIAFDFFQNHLFLIYLFHLCLVQELELKSRPSRSRKQPGPTNSPLFPFVSSFTRSAILRQIIYGFQEAHPLATPIDCNKRQTYPALCFAILQSFIKLTRDKALYHSATVLAEAYSRLSFLSTQISRFRNECL